MVINNNNSGFLLVFYVLVFAMIKRNYGAVRMCKSCPSHIRRCYNMCRVNDPKKAHKMLPCKGSEIILVLIR